MHTYIHTYKTYVHDINVHSYVHTYINRCMHTHIHIVCLILNACMDVWMYACICIPVYVCLHTPYVVPSCAYMYVRMCDYALSISPQSSLQTLCWRHGKNVCACTENRYTCIQQAHIRMVCMHASTHAFRSFSGRVLWIQHHHDSYLHWIILFFNFQQTPSFIPNQDNFACTPRTDISSALFCLKPSLFWKMTDHTLSFKLSKLTSDVEQRCPHISKKKAMQKRIKTSLGFRKMMKACQSCACTVLCALFSAYLQPGKVYKSRPYRSRNKPVVRFLFGTRVPVIVLCRIAFALHISRYWLVEQGPLCHANPSYGHRSVDNSLVPFLSR